MDFHQIKSIIDKHDKIFISSHINPDGDSLGSCLLYTSPSPRDTA